MATINDLWDAPNETQDQPNTQIMNEQDLIDEWFKSADQNQMGQSPVRNNDLEQTNKFKANVYFDQSENINTLDYSDKTETPKLTSVKLKNQLTSQKVIE